MQTIALPASFPAVADFPGKELLKPQDDGKNLFRSDNDTMTAQRWVCYTFPINFANELEALYADLGRKSETRGLIEPQVAFVPYTLNGHQTVVARVSGWLKAEPDYVDAVKNFKTWAQRNNYKWV